MLRPLPALLFALIGSVPAGGCAAPNPTAPGAGPALRTGAPEAGPIEQGGEQAGERTGKQAGESPGAPAGSSGSGFASGPGPAADASASQEPRAATAEPGDEESPQAAGVPLIARVGGTALDLRQLFVRTWWRSPDAVREVLEQLVVERIAALEAQRLGVSVTPAEVEARVDQAWSALQERAGAQDPPLGVEDYVRQVIGLDPGFYQAQLRGDALTQMLLERSIRSWALERERTVARVLAVADRDKLRAAQDLLEAGKPFDEVAATYGLDSESEGGGRRLMIARDERIPLSRVAFQTEIGQVGGPVEQNGAFLLMLVEERLPAYDGPAHRFQEAVATDLAEHPVEDLEYIQWRSAMDLRYAVDLSPFAELVETAGQPPGPRR